MQKFDELLAASKVNKLIKKEEKCNTVWMILGIILAVAAVAGIAFALYKFFTAKNMDEFDEFDICDDDFEDEFEDDYICESDMM